MSTRIAVVGPTHPLKGGVAQHTTVLAQRLVAAGHDVRLVSWARQYPQRLYPGQQTVDVAEFPAFEPTERPLAWNRPDSWLRTGRRLRGFDLVVLAHVTPVQAVPYRIMLALVHGRVRTAVICHNVLPHESGPLDEPLVSSLLGAADLVLVHSAAQRREAQRLTSSPVVVASLPPFAPPAFTRGVPAAGEHRRLLFFGLVRPYKGLDVLVRALAAGPPDLSLRVAGEFWGGTAGTIALCRELGVLDRVELRDGYVAADAVPALFADVDALVLPYRTATGSQGVWAGFEFGVPVIATRAGELADGIRDGEDGLVVVPGDVDALASALRAFYQPGVPERMRAAVRPLEPGPQWDRYLGALLAPPEATKEKVMSGAQAGTQQAAPPGGRALQVAKIGAEQVLWARVALQRRVLGSVTGLPEVPPTDVLRSAAAFREAVSQCRALRLPLHYDRPKNWDALGAVSTVVHALGTDVRVLDAGAARYSPILPWLRLLGVRDLVGNNLEYTRTTRHDGVVFEPGDITAMRYADGTLDAVTCMSVIEHGVPLEPFLHESARVLRSDGLLVLSTDYDRDPPDTTGKSAYGVPVKIFGPDDIRALVEKADGAGLDLVGELQLEHGERPVHWKRTGLDYTFIRLTFRRRADRATSA